jgi:hypothetical protein
MRFEAECAFDESTIAALAGELVEVIGDLGPSSPEAAQTARALIAGGVDPVELIRGEVTVDSVIRLAEAIRSDRVDDDEDEEDVIALMDDDDEWVEEAA